MPNCKRKAWHDGKRDFQWQYLRSPRAYIRNSAKLSRFCKRKNGAMMQVCNGIRYDSQAGFYAICTNYRCRRSLRQRASFPPDRRLVLVLPPGRLPQMHQGYSSVVRKLAVERAQVDLERFGRLFLVAIGGGKDVLDVFAFLLLQKAL